LAEALYKIRGRQIREEDLSVIRDTISRHWERGRTAISRVLCEHWDWRQPNGQLKGMACRALLLKLQEKQVVNLPPPLSTTNHRKPRKAVRRSYNYDTSEIHGTVSEFGSLKIEMVRHTPDEGLWDHLVDKYHYLGRPRIVGAYLKYLAYLDGHLVACLGWGSAAWKVECRDRFIGWEPRTREANLYKVVNNVRFLIPGWVSVEHLASKLLSANIRMLPGDWQAFYRHPVALLETFVDTTRFQGTCYRAANWVYAGLTKGRGRYDRYNRCMEPVKAVYLYPLGKRFREALHA